MHFVKQFTHVSRQPRFYSTKQKKLFGGLWDWGIRGLGDSRIWGLEPFLTIFDRFGPLLNVLFFPILDYCSLFLTVLLFLTVFDCFWSYGPFLAGFHACTRGAIDGRLRHFFSWFKFKKNREKLKKKIYMLFSCFRNYIN